MEEYQQGKAVNLLKHAEFLSGMETSDLAWLSAKADIVSYRQGEFLFKAGETALRFFIVRRGKVFIVKKAADGSSEETAHFITGDVIGDFDFCRSAAYNADAVCAENSEILVFPAKNYTMEHIISTRPDIASRLLLCSVAMIASRVRSSNTLVSTNASWVRQLKQKMYTDAATGLWIRSYIDDEIKKLVQEPAALIAVKPDRFKELCDTWAHNAGDVAMERIAALMKKTAAARQGSWALRLRSNETALIVSACKEHEADEIAKHIAAEFRAIDLDDVTSGSGFRLSASIALALWPSDGAQLGALVNEASSRMMDAWREGGDRIYSLNKRRQHDE